LLAITLATLQITWATWMAIAAIAKLSEYGFGEYVKHYTNWSWTLQVLFYYSTLGVPFLLGGLMDIDSAAGDLTLLLVGIAFLPLHGIVWSVLALVSVMLATKAELFLDVLEEVAPTLVMLGDSIYHFWPVLAILIYYIAYRRVINVALNRVIVRQQLYRSSFRLLLFILYQAFGGSLFSVAVYTLIFDVQEVYKTDVPFAAGVAVVLLTLGAINALPLLITLSIHKVGKRFEYPRSWLMVDDADPELWSRIDAAVVKSI
jgi:hypothetical protein